MKILNIHQNLFYFILVKLCLTGIIFVFDLINHSMRNFTLLDTYFELYVISPQFKNIHFTGKKTANYRNVFKT